MAGPPDKLCCQFAGAQTLNSPASRLRNRADTDLILSDAVAYFELSGEARCLSGEHGRPNRVSTDVLKEPTMLGEQHEIWPKPIVAGVVLRGQHQKSQRSNSCRKPKPHRMEPFSVCPIKIADRDVDRGSYFCVGVAISPLRPLNIFRRPRTSWQSSSPTIIGPKRLLARLRIGHRA